MTEGESEGTNGTRKFHQAVQEVVESLDLVLERAP